MSFRLAILTTHPIQYYAPLFQLLAKEKLLVLKVFYSLGTPENKVDQGFGQKIKWDLPLLEGYDFEFLANTARVKGSSHFNGIQNPDIIQKIQAFSPTALLVYGWAYHGHLKAIRHFSTKIPIWFRGDSTLLHQQSFYKKILRKLVLKWVYSHIDKALCVGEQNKLYYKAFGLSPNQLVFAPHAIDNDRFSEKWPIGSEMTRLKLGLSKTDILILFAGKMDAVKNPLLLIRAFSQLERENIHLLMVGNGALEKMLKLEAEKFNTAYERPKIHFLPFQNQTKMPSIYQACDIFCLPSTSETWGLAVNEAMASGKAILVSDQVGCAIDLVYPNKNGIVFKSNSLEKLVIALKQMTENKSNLCAMGLASKKIIADWSFSNQMKAIKSLIKQ